MCAFPKCYCFLKDGKEMDVFAQPPTAALIIFPDAPDGGKKLFFYSSFSWAIIYRPIGFIYFHYYSFSSLQTINLNNMILESQYNLHDRWDAVYRVFIEHTVPLTLYYFLQRAEKKTCSWRKKKVRSVL